MKRLQNFWRYERTTYDYDSSRFMVGDTKRQQRGRLPGSPAVCNESIRPCSRARSKAPFRRYCGCKLFFFFLFFCSSFSKWILRWVFISFLLQKEALEVESQKAKEEREKKRKEIEDIVDSQLKKTSLNVLSNH